MYKFLGRKKLWWIGISLLIMVPGIVSLIFWKLPFGIDFRGGTQMEITAEKSPNEDTMRQKLAGLDSVKALTLSKSGESYLIRMLPISEDQHRQIVKDLEKDFGKITEKEYQSVGPSVSSDLTKKAIIAVCLAALLIVLFLAYSFRGLTAPLSSWRFGVTAVIALLHDLVITVGTFSIVAHFLHYEVDASFITALLTVMGFSVHDTIVVFDRVRENALKNRGLVETDFEQIADSSLQQTLNRSLATSLTVIFTLTALTLLGGESIRAFVMTLLIGIFIGTYSSIFTATPLVVIWQQIAARRVQKRNSTNT